MLSCRALLGEYLEGSKVKQGESVEEAQALECHLNHSGTVGFLK